MFECRDLGRLSFAVCLTYATTFALGACTKSHDILADEEPLRAGSSATPAAGSGATGATGATGAAGSAGMGAAGRVSVGSAGRAGSVGAAGRAGTGAGTAGRAAAAGSGSVLACGTCNAASVFGGLISAPACCTTDNKCGLDLTSLGMAGCAEQNAAGTLDASCPAQSLSGISFQGCCRPDGTCGSLDTYLGLGCVAGTGATPTACTVPK
jgi:collagen type I/II/III/V/XI/XXIV/XXVII alpha